MKIGAHVSASGGLVKALELGSAMGAEVIQVFLSSPRSWAFKQLTEEDVIRFRDEMYRSSIEVVCHASYLINLASPDPLIREKSEELLLLTMSAASTLGITDVILHTGSHRGEGLSKYRNYLVEALARASDLGSETTRLTLENTAGAGGTIGARFDELGSLIADIDSMNNVGVCLDTQHMFAAGYYFGTPESVSDVVGELRRTVGPPTSVHMNDSKVPLGKGTDRHANLGEGEIGEAAIAMLLRDPIFAESKIILEVPGEGDGPRDTDVEFAKKILR